MFKKPLLLISVILLGYQVVFSQAAFPYDQEWKKIDSLVNLKNLPKSALAEVNKVYTASKKEKQEAQWVKAIIYKNYLQQMDDNRDITNSIADLESEMLVAPPRVVALLKSIEAEELSNYLVSHRYNMGNRTTILNDTSSDIRTWSVERMGQKIYGLYFASLGDQELLQETPLEKFNPVLIQGNLRELRPTLFDLLCWRALDYFRTDYSLNSSSKYDFIRNDPQLFSEGPFFMYLALPREDSLSNFLNALIIYQKLLRFHAKDVPLDPWIDADISRIQYVNQYSIRPDKDSLYMRALGRITQQYPSLSASSSAWYLQAAWWAQQATSYDPLMDTIHRFDNLRAIEICGKLADHHDSGEGRQKCEELLRNIRRPGFSVDVERVNLPDLPFRALVTYKNIPRIYCRIIRIDDATRESFEYRSYDLKSWKKWIQMNAEKSFSQQIPDTKDYQRHRVEIKLDALPVGQYALLASSDSLFSDKAVLGMTSFFCSSIAFVQRGQDYFVLDRNSGQPLNGIRIKSFIQGYSGSGIVFKPSKNYISNEHGYFRLTESNQYNQIKLEFYSGADFLSSSEYIYSVRRDENDEYYYTAPEYEKKYLKDNFFTDRSIYRPEQTVYFKDILITKDYKTKKFKPVAGLKTKWYLKDVNDQKLDSLELKTNLFGSVQGSFRLPQNGVNGEFSIVDSLSGQETGFSVEEYKRPTFYIEFDTVKTSYRVMDTIRVKGFARAYAGNSIDGAYLTYRVSREARFPDFWYYRKLPNISGSEIAHGESRTNSNSEFSIRFPALPDPSVSANEKPIYNYRIEVTVTDANGESRSESMVISAGYQSYEIVSALKSPDILPRDSLYRVPVSTKNMSGVYVKKEISLSLFPLESPTRLIRKRYWVQPDLFILTEQQFIQFFPSDEYKNETEPQSWKQLSSVYNKTGETNPDGYFDLDKTVLAAIRPGMYLFEFRGRDSAGDDVVEKKYVELTGNNGLSGLLKYNFYPSDYVTAAPGSTVNLKTGSDADFLYVIRSTESATDTAARFSFYKMNRGIENLNIAIKEADQGGFGITDVFIKNNRWYQSIKRVYVPWSTRRLDISYTTWKDKTTPGANEKWKIKITGYRKEAVAAEVLTSMYDASLDQFKMHSWGLPEFYPVYYPLSGWDASSNFLQTTMFHRPVVSSAEQINIKTYERLVSFSGRHIRDALMGKASGMEVADMASVSFEKVELKRQDVTDANFAVTKMVEDSALTTEKPTEKNPEQKDVQIRKNFKETAFFQPDLKTDAQGNVEINFTMPDALTRWKWMVLANTADLSFGYAEKLIVTQKELMVQTNMPRFFREGDTMLLPVKISNLSSHDMNGTVQLEWMNPETEQNLDKETGNQKKLQSFHVNASQSSVVFFPAVIPSQFTRPLLYRVIAKDSADGISYSDGEENIIPVLSNRMLVTESLPINMNGQTEKRFEFVKLLKSKESPTLQTQSLTVEYTTNPAWYAVQAMPYLMEFPYECAEQTFNRFYSNALATHIVKVSPALKAVFEKWKNTDTAALLSNLQKNEELKTVILRETPWVLEAQDESQQKKNLALLFDMINMQKNLKSAFEKLEQMQSEGGGFSWFKGGRDDRYITQYIITGIGRLKKLNAIPENLKDALNKMTKTAIAYLDREIRKDYDHREKTEKLQDIDAIQVQYLYMRSFFPEISVPANSITPINFYRKLAIGKWMKQSVYMQGMIALYLSRTGDVKTSKSILASLKENATNSPELGTWWKAISYGYYWFQAPVETQSLLIEVFREMKGDPKYIDGMKYWLLQQKHTSHWPTTKATADACYALLLSGNDWLASTQSVSVQLGNYNVNSYEEKTEAGTGYFKKRIPGDQVIPSMGNIIVKTNSPDSLNRQPSTVNRQPSWGAVYWQYFENLDKITTAQTGLSITKQLFLERNTDSGPALDAVSENNILKPGDKLVMRIVIKSDRDLEYVHLKDMRAACLEPVNVLSEYKWQGGLGYYETTKDASTSFFFDRLPKGTHVFEYPVFATTAGAYSNGISSLECMYAPEFAAHSEGVQIHVTSK